MERHLERRREIGVLLATVLTAGALAGCGSVDDGAAAAPPTGPGVTATDTSSPTGSPTGSPSDAPTTDTFTEPPAVGATTESTPPPPVGLTNGPVNPAPGDAGTPSPTPPALLKPGAKGPQVLAVQQRLTALGYWLGSPDGSYGDLTVQAVTALQKAAGLGRDGVVGPNTRAALTRGVRPKARSTKGVVVEVDKKRQLLLFVTDGRVTRIVNTSTGSGAYYTAPDGHRAHAVTPAGSYRVFRAIGSWHTAPLGHLYKPRYFNGGIAVHGYPSVPPGPASHGCVRVSLPAMDMIWREGLLPMRGAVRVY